MTLTGFDLAQAAVIGGLCGAAAILACDLAAGLWWRIREARQHTDNDTREEQQ